MGDNEAMGRITQEVVLTNVSDGALVEAGHLAPEKVRKATLTVLVDTGATTLVLPEDVIQRLGIPVVRTVKTRLGNGEVISRILHGPVRLLVLGRVVNVDVLSAPTGVPALLGQIPLEGLDFVIDPRNQRLIPNPESPDPTMALVDLL